MTFIIAEAGVNHSGDILQAYRLIDAAKDSGADAVKFQLFNSRKLWGDDRITQYELSYEQLGHLKDKADSVDIEFMCTPFDVEGVEFLTPLVKRHKIASGCRKPDILEAADGTNLPLIVSTGMGDFDDIKEWLWGLRFVLTITGTVTLLHCTSSYPCQSQDVNLKAMREMGDYFGCPYGFSDHTQGILASPMAVAMGATVIEKHLTLNKLASGPDHSSSIEPREFKQMVSNIREVELMLGSSEKKILQCEQELREKWYAGG
jgi:N,N'-diacetyllegionaminate synthase